MSKLRILFFFVLLFFLACKPSIDKELKRIEEMEHNIYAGKSNSFNLEKAKLLADSYEKFIINFPNDTNVPNFLFKSAELYINCNEPQKSINNFDKIIKEHSDYKNIANVYFLIGFIYDSQIKNVEKARTSYQLFINKYPTHELVKDAKACLKNLGKSDEEIIKEFELKIKQEQDSIQKLKIK